MKFSDIELHPALKKGIDQLGFVECTDIQREAIPHILGGSDVAGLAQTGTGKTAAFLLPLMDRVLRAKTPKAAELEANSLDQPKDQQVSARKTEQPEAEETSVDTSEQPKKVRSLITDWKPSSFVMVLVPTRELADQVYNNIKELCPDGEISAVAVFGGTSYEKQIPKIKAGVDFIVATPGRLIDLYKEHVVDLKQVKAVVFDEADRMFDMGFKDDMKYILKRINRERQFLVFSATLNFDVLNTAYEFGADPVEVNIGKDAATADNVEDEIFHVGHDDKPGYLLSVLKKNNPKQVIIFSNFKRNVEKIALFLNRNGYPALGISSLLSQGQRNRVMDQFKSSDSNNILVATDVAARGLDVEGVDMVINFELPDDPENYVHRIGRTGRANAKGVAFSMVSDRDVEALARIEEYTKKKLETGWLEDSEIVTEFKDFPRDSDRELSRESRSDRGSGGRPVKGGRGGGRSGKPGDARRARGGDGKDRKRPNRKRKPDGRRGKDEAKAKAGDDLDQPQISAKDGGSRNTHRDRKTGRHGSKRGGQGSKKKTTRSASNKFSKKSSNKKRRSSGKSTSARSAAKTEPKTIGQKVGSFFRKMFGNG